MVAPPRTRLDRILRYALATFGLACLLLAAGEGIARLAFDQPATPYLSHPLFHLVRSPHFKQRKLSIEEPAYWFDFESNALGFRGKNMQTIEKPKGSYR